MLVAVGDGLGISNGGKGVGIGVLVGGTGVAVGSGVGGTGVGVRVSNGSVVGSSSEEHAAKTDRVSIKPKTTAKAPIGEAVTVLKRKSVMVEFNCQTSARVLDITSLDNRHRPNP